MEPTHEEWRAVARDPRYEVSNLGRVRRGDRVLKFGGSRYRHIGIGKVSAYVHHLVAEAFIGPRPEGHEVAHRDGDHWHNHVSNLAYLTPQENGADKVRHRTASNGALARKLTWESVTQIRERFAGGESKSSLAREFGVSHVAIIRICRNETWRPDCDPRALADYAKEEK